MGPLLPIDPTQGSAVDNADPELRLGLAPRGEWLEVPQRRCIVFPLICGRASPDVRFKALRCHGLRHRKREDQHGYRGQASHGLIIGRRVLLPQCFAGAGSASLTEPFGQRQLDGAAIEAASGAA